MIVDFRDLEQIYFLDQTFIIRLKNGMTVFYSRDYCKATTVSKLICDPYNEADTNIEVEMTINYNDLLDYWDSGLSFISFKAEQEYLQKDFITFNSLIKYLRKILISYQYATA